MDFAEIHVDQKYHRHIIGKGGASGELINLLGSLLPFCKIILVCACMLVENV